MASLRLPDSAPGLKATSLTVRRWLKKPGDPVAKGDCIVELEADDALVQLEAPMDGVLASIAVAEGKTAPLGALLAQIDSAATASEATSPIAAPVAAPRGAVTPILMPQAGNTMEEGTVLKWRVRPGDRIAVGQVIFEVETDKATMDVEATHSGRLTRIVAAEGAVVPVKQPVAFLAESDADVDAFLAGAPLTGAATAPAVPAISAAQPPTATTPASRTNSGRIKASPAARKLAAKRGVDLAGIATGSGPAGRILSTDVARTTAVPLHSPGKIRRPLSKMRRAIATNLQTSKQTIPHFYLRLTIHADALLAFQRERKDSTGCTLNDLILLAVGRTVGEFAVFRSHIDGNDIVESPAANIGVAVSVENGLVVPVVCDVDKLNLAQLATESKRIIAAARAGKIENIGKGVFTITNMGMLGVEEFAAIINPPESGILAIAALRAGAIVEDGVVKAARVMTMTLSVDHRVVDGAVAAAFMAKLKERLEAPATGLA